MFHSCLNSRFLQFTISNFVSFSAGVHKCIYIVCVLGYPILDSLSCYFPGGKELHGLVMSYPAGQAVSLYDDCDWIDSPARPEFLY